MWSVLRVTQPYRVLIGQPTNSIRNFCSLPAPDRCDLKGLAAFLPRLIVETLRASIVEEHYVVLFLAAGKHRRRRRRA